MNDLNFQQMSRKGARPLQLSSESSSEDSDSDDNSSVLASQWKRRPAKPTEADSSDDGRRRSKSSRKSSRSDIGKKGRKTAEYDSEDQALVPSGSRRSGSIPAAPPVIKPTASKKRRSESEMLPDDSELEAETTGAKTMRRSKDHPELNEGEGDPPPAKRRGKSKTGVETFGIFEAQKGKIISIAIAISIELAGPAFFQAHTDSQRQTAVEAAIDLNSYAFPDGIRGFRKEKRANPLPFLNFMNKIKGSCSSHNSVSNIDVKFELLRVLLLAFPFMLRLGFSFPDTPFPDTPGFQTLLH